MLILIFYTVLYVLSVGIFVIFIIMVFLRRSLIKKLRQLSHIFDNDNIHYGGLFPPYIEGIINLDRVRYCLLPDRKGTHIVGASVTIPVETEEYWTLNKDECERKLKRDLAMASREFKSLARTKGFNHVYHFKKKLVCYWIFTEHTTHSSTELIFLDPANAKEYIKKLIDVYDHLTY